MRMQLSAITVMGLLSGAVFSDEPAKLVDESDRINYAIGHQIGVDFKKQQVQLDQRSLKQGIHDGNERKQPQLDPREMNQRLRDLKKNITQEMESKAIARMQKRQAEIKNKRQLGREFLEANKTKTGVTTTPSGLQYKIITPGSGPMPKAIDKVKIDYTSKRLNGHVFDGSFKKGGTQIYQVNKLIPGFSEALKMMQPGAKWELYLPSDQAYGRRGPLGYETVIIEVKLLEILEQNRKQPQATASEAKNMETK
ncbi:MAG: FKBP-type peptidyl-prolyl cis-trans isomerase [Candidatus Thiodiazotropha sp. (ex Myrtea sp. 'scaly one' KF741663)]|nr:FKBP-type peptidyl-prolyl cis-trans isomerase [Candidatus Thiodiazotropha sp. (ex Myrtea sp. 'scaly one' KF741663)]